jgi:hypothetical protein
VAKNYSNRTDLQNPAQKIAKQAATGQAYGEAKKQMDSQNAVPMGASPTQAAPPPQVQRPTPGGLGDLARPTERPGDLMTPMYQNTPMMFNSSDPVMAELSTLYAQYPNDDLASLLSALKYGA